MEVHNQDSLAGSGVDRPTVSFPVGLALLVIMLVGIAGFFFSCLYWDRIRSVLCGSGDLSPPPSDHEKPIRADHQMGKTVDEAVRSVSVLMPGDKVPKFIATVCPPCEPPASARIAVVVHKL